MYTCGICKKEMTEQETYEYRGFTFCAEDFEKGIEKVDWKRNEIIKSSEARLKPLKGLDLNPNNVIGRANQEILKAKIEVASKETFAEREYEKGIL